MKDYVVYTLKLVKYLREEGFNCKDVMPNADKPQLNVFIYDDSPELRETVDRYIKQYKEQKETL